MKNLFYVCTLIGVLLFVSCDKDESNDITEEAISKEIPFDGASLSSQVQQEQELVAKIQKNGHEFRFLKAATNNEIVVAHKLSQTANEEQIGGLLEDKESTAFDLFVSITDATIEVPALIAATSTNSALELSGRKVNNAASTLEILESDFEITSTKAACYDVGFNQFRTQYCFAPVVSTPTNIEFCDNGTWTSLTRNSVFDGQWQERDDVLAWTNVICGMTVVELRAWVPGDGAWVLSTKVELTNGIWRVRHYTSNYTERQVKRYRTTNTGSFRAFTRFF